MKLMGGSSTRRPPPPALPPPRPVIVVVVDLKVNKNEALRVERRPFDIVGQVLKAGSCRVELVTVGCGVARSLSRSSELGTEMPAQRETALKLLQAQTQLAAKSWEPGAPLLCFWLPEECTCSCKQRVGKQQGDKDPLHPDLTLNFGGARRRLSLDICSQRTQPHPNPKTASRPCLFLCHTPAL